MNEFYKLAFANHLRNNEEITRKIDACFEPAEDFLRERLSQSVCDDFMMLLTDCFVNATDYAGVVGMEFAMGVLDGTIKQYIGG